MNPKTATQATTNSVYTIDDLRRLGPCYDPTRYLPEDWQGTVLDILSVIDCPAKDRLWVTLRLLDDRTARRFCVGLARQALSLLDEPDARCVAACVVGERFAHGQATLDELLSAHTAAAYAFDAAQGLPARTACLVTMYALREDIGDWAYGVVYEIATVMHRASADEWDALFEAQVSRLRQLFEGAAAQ